MRGGKGSELRETGEGKREEKEKREVWKSYPCFL